MTKKKRTGPSTHRWTLKPKPVPLAIETLDKINFQLKSLDAQAKTIIILLNDLKKEQDRISKFVEITIGERIEKLRQDFRNGIAVLISSDSTGDAMKIAKDFIFAQARTRKQV